MDEPYEFQIPAQSLFHDLYLVHFCHDFSTYNILKKINVVKLKNKEDLALYTLLYTESRYRKYVPIKDDEALQGFRDLTQIEGIIPALESSHAMAYVTKLAPTMSKDQIIIATVSGRGDKDLMTVAKIDGIPMVDL